MNTTQPICCFFNLNTEISLHLDCNASSLYLNHILYQQYWCLNIDKLGNIKTVLF